MLLSADQLDALNREGYLVLPDLFSAAEVDALRDRLPVLFADGHEGNIIERESGEVRTLMGRRRPMPELQSSDGRVRSNAENAAVNAPVQGSAADLIKIAMIRLDERLRKEAFEAAFPAQFIAEGLDQTRGWFYTLLVLGTALFDRAPFQNVIVNGMVLAEDGSKMSKSKKNYPDPKHVLDSYGADALRAYLINSPIVRADPLRFSEEGVKEIVRTVLLPLRNAWSFFTLYARADQWHPATGLEGVETPALEDRPELDRWICSVLQSLIREVNTQMEGYYLYRVVPPLLHFIDDLTNWYIRRSRRRFWRAASDEAGRVDKAAAYATLYEVLVTFSKVIAPVLPFISEQLYQHLVFTPGVAAEGEDSIHLCAYPEAEVEKIDEALEAIRTRLTEELAG